MLRAMAGMRKRSAIGYCIDHPKGGFPEMITGNDFQKSGVPSGRLCFSG